MQAIRESKAVILIVTEFANTSHLVLREVEQAVRIGKPIIPILVRRVQLRDELDFFVSSHQWVDATGEHVDERRHED